MQGEGNYQPDPYGMNAPIVSDSKSDFLDKIRPDEIVTVLRNLLMGKDWIDGRWQTVPEIEDRSLSFTGAWEISISILSAANQNVAISKFKEDYVRVRTRGQIKTIMRKCLRNWKAYGISSTDQFYYVKDIAQNIIFASLMQPEGEGIRKLFSSGVIEYKEGGNERPQGLLSGLLRR